MLIKLKVQNFAIIEDIEISFKDGLTVLTGETGAGKSLIIDCIGLLLGERAASEMIRQGEEKAIVSGVFDNQTPLVKAILEKINIPDKDGLIEITRTISSSKNVVKINDTTVSLNDLKQLMSLIADIHQQFDMVKLFNNENYLAMVDGFNSRLINQYLDKYISSYKDLKEGYTSYQSLVKRIDEFNRHQDEYEYAYNEIKALSLKENEEEEIDSEISLLENYDKIYSLLMESKEVIDGEALSDVYQVKENINKLLDYQSDLQDSFSRLNNAYYELEDIFDELKRKADHLNYDPSRLNELIERSHAIKSLKKKYGKSFSELLAYQDELMELLKYKEDYSVLLKEEKDKLVSLFNDTYTRANDLHKVREDIALSITKDLEKTLSELGLACRFNVTITQKEKNDDLDISIFNESGIDTVEFFIETNIGEGLKPLAKVVSGGELSRIMLAIKLLYIKAQKINTIIFDEIDTGISGDVASKVARKIKELSYSHQVITITHLPQVASLSDHHIRIVKEVNKGRTYTTIKELSLDEKIYEIASLISAGKVTDKQLEYAKEMVMERK